MTQKALLPNAFTATKDGVDHEVEILLGRNNTGELVWFISFDGIKGADWYGSDSEARAALSGLTDEGYSLS